MFYARSSHQIKMVLHHFGLTWSYGLNLILYCQVKTKMAVNHRSPQNCPMGRKVHTGAIPIDQNYPVLKDFFTGCWELVTIRKDVSWISCCCLRVADHFRAIQKFKEQGPWTIKIPSSMYEENPEIVLRALTELRKQVLLVV